ncbi:MAG: YfhO family protein [Rhodothermales bacterium]|nr:YfhO family protein [Rhodothermales bacterium]
MAGKKNRKSSKLEIDIERGSFWSSLPHWKRHAISATVLVVLSFIFFAPVHFSGKSLVGGDTVGWRAMAESMIEYREATGDEALWATNPFGGMPGYLISYQRVIPQIDEAVTLLRGLIWPSSHLIVLLLGMYLVGFLLTRNSLASILGAVAFGFTTYIPVFLAAGHNTKFVTLAFAPIFVAAFLYAMRKPGPLAGALFGIALAAILRGDHVQIAYYFSVVCGVWWLVEAVSAVRKKETNELVKATGWLLFGSVLGLLMVAQPYLSLWEYKSFSIRGTGDLSAGASSGLDWSYAMAWSQGRLEMLTLLIADAAGGAQAYWGPKIFTGGPHYFGAAAIVLAITGMFTIRNRATLALTISLVLTLVFALGENVGLVNRLMYNFFPLFNAFRVPETWLIASAFLVAALAVVGCDYVMNKSTSVDGNRLLYPAIGLSAFLLVLLVSHSSIFSFEKPDERVRLETQIAAQNSVPPSDPRVGEAADQYLAEAKVIRQESFRNDTIRSLLVTFLVGLLIFLFVRKKISAPVLAAAVIVIVAFDLTTVARRYLNEDRLTGSSDARQQVQEFEFDRFIQDRVSEAGGPGHFRVLSLEGDVNTTARPAFFYETVNGYHAAKLQIFQDYLDSILFDSRRQPTGLGMDLLAIRYVISPAPLPGMQPAFADEQSGWSVLEKKDVLPRARFVSNVVVEEDPARILERLQSPEFDITGTAIVSGSEGVVSAPLDSTSLASVDLSSFGPRRIEYNVETDSDRLLVLAEVYYPAGWKAFVDDVETQIYQTNYLQRGILVPAGRHTVRFDFAPSSHRTGILISGVGTLIAYLIVILALVRWWRARSYSPAIDTAPADGG